MPKGNQSISNEYLLFLLQFNPRSRLDFNTFLTVLGELDEVSADPGQTRIDLVIYSNGGDVHDAYRIISSIRARCATCRTVVPLQARSAATLMALGGDSIVMGPDSELGPLDVQMEHPHTEAMRISGLDAVKPVEILAQIAANLAFDVGLRMRAEIGLGRRDSIEMAFDYTAACIEPVLQKLDPIAVTLGYRELSVAAQYGEELLKRFMFRNDPSGEDLARRIAVRLVWDYPSHSYAIRRGGVQELGLRLVRRTDYEHWEAVESAFWRSVVEGNDVICLVTPDEVESKIPREPAAEQGEEATERGSENEGADSREAEHGSQDST